MWVQATVPAIGEDGIASVARLHAAPGERLEPGSPLLDLTVDLSAGIARDCPPVSTCRIVLREPLYLRGLLVVPGDATPAGTALALFSTTPDAPEAAPVRAARIAMVAVIHHDDWWSDEA